MVPSDPVYEPNNLINSGGDDAAGRVLSIRHIPLAYLANSTSFMVPGDMALLGIAYRNDATGTVLIIPTANNQETG